MKRNNKLDFYNENQSIVESTISHINLDRLVNMLKNSKYRSIVINNISKNSVIKLIPEGP